MDDFRPLPLLGNGHIQTLLGHWWKGPPLRAPTGRRLVRLPDGDSLVLHDSVPPGWVAGGRIAVLIHGMGGSHQSGYVQRTAAWLLREGVRVVRVDLRGAGAGMALARKSYNGGCSEDVRAALADTMRIAPTSPIILIGFSLGGNIVLKLAGEAAERPVAGLNRVIAVAPPIDLAACSRLIELPRNQVYHSFFVRDLVGQAKQRQRLFPDLPPLRFPRRLTLRLFDEHYTAPRAGYTGAADYYRRASSAPLLGRVPVPTLILTARDDPFIAVEPFEALRVPGHVEVRIVPGGGHLGFLGWDGSGGVRWAERWVVQWVVG
jgi:predicted alpha/beta-fold hydrolase